MKVIIDLEMMAKDTKNMSEEGKGSCLLRNLRLMWDGATAVPWMKKHKETKPKIPTVPTKYTELFEMFWQAWPRARRTAKRTAFKSWWKTMHTQLPEDHLLRECLGTLQWQSNSEQWTKDAGQFIPMPATWLNNERWNDEDPNEGRGMESYITDGGEEKMRPKCS